VFSKNQNCNINFSNDWFNISLSANKNTLSLFLLPKFLLFFFVFIYIVFFKALMSKVENPRKMLLCLEWGKRHRDYVGSFRN